MTKKSTPQPDLTAELAKLDQAPAGDAPTGDAPAVTADEQAQLDREKEAVEAIAAGTATVAEAVTSTLTPEEQGQKALEDLAKRAEDAGLRYYYATGDVAISDPDTGKSFSNEKPTKSPLTGWVEFQLANGKLRVDEEE
jgi:hypothetical protein